MICTLVCKCCHGYSFVDLVIHNILWIVFSSSHREDIQIIIERSFA